MQTAADRHSLVVSIHDVDSSVVEDVTDILKDLQGQGISKVSLLTVPDYHRKGKMTTRPDFCRWLQEQKDASNEIVLHGYFHLRESKSRTGILNRVMTQVYTAGEGEFYDLPYGKARERLELGREVLTAAGVCPKGFIAPAWLLGHEAERAVADAGFRYTVRLASVTDFLTGKVHPARTLVYSTRAAWRRTTSLVWNPLIKKICRRCPLVRISIHPPDWKFPALRAQILRLIAEVLAARFPMTYHEWICLNSSSL